MDMRNFHQDYEFQNVSPLMNIQSSQLARFSTYKTKLKNKYYKRWGHLRPQLIFNSFYLSQQWNFYIPKIRKKKVSIPLGFHDISLGN